MKKGEEVCGKCGHMHRDHQKHGCRECPCKKYVVKEE